jgi:hypothetical protein
MVSVSRNGASRRLLEAKYMDLVCFLGSVEGQKSARKTTKKVVFESLLGLDGNEML